MHLHSAEILNFILIIPFTSTPPAPLLPAAATAGQHIMTDVRLGLLPLPHARVCMYEKGGGGHISIVHVPRNSVQQE